MLPADKIYTILYSCGLRCKALSQRKRQPTVRWPLHRGSEVKPRVWLGMAKLGSKKNPLILRIADEARVDEIATVCEENEWHFILGFNPDEEEDLSDLERKLSPPTEFREIKVGRNSPCWCGSGKKYKKCCGVPG